MANQVLTPKDRQDILEMLDSAKISLATQVRANHGKKELVYIPRSEYPYQVFKNKENEFQCSSFDNAVNYYNEISL